MTINSINPRAFAKLCNEGKKIDLIDVRSERCRPDGHQARWPKTSYSARDPDPGSIVPNLLGSNVRVRFRDRRPRYLPVRSRVGVGRTVRRDHAPGQWHPSPSGRGSMVGRTQIVFEGNVPAGIAKNVPLRTALEAAAPAASQSCRMG